MPYTHRSIQFSCASVCMLSLSGDGCRCVCVCACVCVCVCVCVTYRVQIMEQEAKFVMSRVTVRVMAGVKDLCTHTQTHTNTHIYTHTFTRHDARWRAAILGRCQGILVQDYTHTHTYTYTCLRHIPCVSLHQTLSLSRPRSVNTHTRTHTHMRASSCSPIPIMLVASTCVPLCSAVWVSHTHTGHHSPVTLQSVSTRVDLLARHHSNPYSGAAPGRTRTPTHTHTQHGTHTDSSCT